MKKIFLFFVLLIFPFTLMAVGNISKSVTATIGKSFYLDPLSDICGNNYNSGSIWRTVYDETIFTINVSNPVNSHTKLDVIPNKTGLYTIACWVDYRGAYYCATYNVTVVSLTSIEIPATVSIEIGGNYTLNPIFYPTGVQATVTYSSDNTNIATVENVYENRYGSNIKTNKGKITAKGIGTCVVSCTSSTGIKAYCTVTVTPIYVSEITLDFSSYELEVEEKFKLNANISPSNASIKDVEWKSSNENVAFVSKEGEVTAVAPGYAYITASATDGSNLSSSCLVHIKAPKVLAQSILFEVESITIVEGNSEFISPIFTPENVSSKTLTWQSSNTSIVSVDEYGKATAYSVGMCQITATTTDGTDLSASLTVYVAPRANPNLDNLSLLDITSAPGSSVLLPIKLKNNENLNGFEFSLLLPNYITIEEVILAGRAKGFSISYNQNDQLTKFSCLSTSGRVLSIENDIVMYISLSIGEETIPDEYPLSLTNITLFSEDGKEMPGIDNECTLTILDVLLGDVNGNGVVNTNDAIAIVNYIIGKEQPIFIESAADVNGNGTINTNDAISIVNYIIGKTSSLRAKDHDICIDSQE